MNNKYYKKLNTKFLNTLRLNTEREKKHILDIIKHTIYRKYIGQEIFISETQNTESAKH